MPPVDLRAVGAIAKKCLFVILYPNVRRLNEDKNFSNYIFNMLAVYLLLPDQALWTE